ncbi:MAG TPA: hypothetical protein VFZ65_19645 [Planctomycetota bacterium]|nr:hypothetical protein [Planctomycetota bacterium]
MRKWHQVLYGAFAVFWFAVGGLGVAGFASGTADEVHQSRELGAFAVFLGWMHVWCLRHYERRLPVHAGLVLFAALLSGIHWREWVVGARTIVSPLVNSVPFVVLAAMLPSGKQQRPSPEST